MTSFEKILNNNIKIIYIFLIILFILILNRSNFSSKDEWIPIQKSNESLLSDNPLLDQVREITKCEDKDFILEIIENDNYFIVKNYIKASRYFHCHESITFTTHLEYKFLDNVIPLLKRWKGPISIAIYTPGHDLETTMNIIFHLRNCNIDKNLVRELVSFSIFFDKMEKNIENILTMYERMEVNRTCSEAEVFLNLPAEESYRFKENLSYPINVARNIARDAAMTHFIFPCDIELYPNPNFIDGFFRIIANDKERKLVTEKNVFALAIFEIDFNITIPENKKDLVKLYNEHKVVQFHHDICPDCHETPEIDRWLNDTDYENMKIITITKRQGRHYHWEPFFVGTNDEPYFEEKILFENSSDKMPQAYTMCILDYKYNILSNGFLIHRNGIKTLEEAKSNGYEEGKKFILEKILPDIHQKFGQRKECKMF